MHAKRRFFIWILQLAEWDESKIFGPRADATIENNQKADESPRGYLLNWGQLLS
jgi:hypothetical protein